jgi:hypothetical protein
LTGMFGGSDESRSAAIRTLKICAGRLFEASEDDAILVSQLRCTEPGCPPIETAVALLRKGSEPRHVKIHKPAVDVTVEDLRAAIVGHKGHALGDE